MTDTDVVTRLWIAVFLLVALCPIDRLQCPRGWWVNGIRPSGRFSCLRTPIGPGDNAPQPPGEIRSRIRCTGGQVAIVVDYRTVGCQRR